MKKSSFVASAPPTVVIQGSTKSICCFVLLMIYLSLFRGSVVLFVWESSSLQWILHIEPKMHDVMNFNKKLESEEVITSGFSVIL